MNITELDRERLIRMKQAYLSEEYPDVSMSELADADDLVPDETVYDYYAGVNFVEDDF